MGVCTSTMMDPDLRDTGSPPDTSRGHASTEIHDGVHQAHSRPAMQQFTYHNTPGPGGRTIDDKAAPKKVSGGNSGGALSLGKEEAGASVWLPPHMREPHVHTPVSKNGGTTVVTGASGQSSSQAHSHLTASASGMTQSSSEVSMRDTDSARSSGRLMHAPFGSHPNLVTFASMSGTSTPRTVAVGASSAGGRDREVHAAALAMALKAGSNSGGSSPGGVNQESRRTVSTGAAVGSGSRPVTPTHGQTNSAPQPFRALNFVPAPPSGREQSAFFVTFSPSPPESPTGAAAAAAAAAALPPSTSLTALGRSRSTVVRPVARQSFPPRSGTFGFNTVPALASSSDGASGALLPPAQDGIQRCHSSDSVQTMLRRVGSVDAISPSSATRTELSLVGQPPKHNRTSSLERGSRPAATVLPFTFQAGAGGVALTHVPSCRAHPAQIQPGSAAGSPTHKHTQATAGAGSAHNSPRRSQTPQSYVQLQNASVSALLASGVLLPNPSSPGRRKYTPIRAAATGNAAAGTVGATSSTSSRAVPAAGRGHNPSSSVDGGSAVNSPSNAAGPPATTLSTLDLVAASQTYVLGSSSGTPGGSQSSTPRKGHRGLRIDIGGGAQGLGAVPVASSSSGTDSMPVTPSRAPSHLSVAAFKQAYAAAYQRAQAKAQMHANAQAAQAAGAADSAPNTARGAGDHHTLGLGLSQGVPLVTRSKPPSPTSASLRRRAEADALGPLGEGPPSARRARTPRPNEGATHTRMQSEQISNVAVMPPAAVLGRSSSQDGVALARSPLVTAPSQFALAPVVAPPSPVPSQALAAYMTPNNILNETDSRFHEAYKQWFREEIAREREERRKRPADYSPSRSLFSTPVARQPKASGDVGEWSLNQAPGTASPVLLSPQMPAVHMSPHGSPLLSHSDGDSPHTPYSPGAGVTLFALLRESNSRPGSGASTPLLHGMVPNGGGGGGGGCGAESGNSGGTSSPVISPPGSTTSMYRTAPLNGGAMVPSASGGVTTKPQASKQPTLQQALLQHLHAQSSLHQSASIAPSISAGSHLSSPQMRDGMSPDSTHVTPLSTNSATMATPAQASV